LIRSVPASSLISGQFLSNFPTFQGIPDEVTYSHETKGYFAAVCNLHVLDFFFNKNQQFIHLDISSREPANVLGVQKVKISLPSTMKTTPIADYMSNFR